MNVVFVGHFSYPGGMAGCKRVQHLIDLLQSDGHETRVIQVRGTDQTDPVETGEHRDTPYAKIGRPLKRDRWRILQLLRCFLNVLWFLGTFYGRKHRNIIYHYKGPTIENGLFLAFARCMGYRVVYDLTEDIRVLSTPTRHVFQSIKRMTARRMRDYLALLADGVLTVSNRLRRQAETAAGGRIPVGLRPITVDLDRFDGTTGSFHDPVRVLYSGSFAEKDGVENLISAIERVAESHPNLELIMTGRGEPDRMEQVKQRIQNSSARECMDLKGFLPEDLYFETVNTCDIACMTRTDSAFAQAGFPFKLGEYLAAGTPVLASNVAGVDDFLRHRESAYLLEPDSIDSIVEGLTFFLDHPEKAQDIGRRGRRVAERHFSLDSQQWLVDEFLRRL